MEQKPIEIRINDRQNSGRYADVVEFVDWLAGEERCIGTMALAIALRESARYPEWVKRNKRKAKA